MFGPEELIARADVHILGIEPPIHRTLELPYDLTLDGLHYIIQAAFGWDDTHLHRFQIGGLDFGPPDPEDDDALHRIFNSREVRLLDFRLRYDVPVELLYEYDFGDRWVHLISLHLARREMGTLYPRCLAGSRSAPPEDSGGTEAYAELVVAWNDLKHPKHKEVRDWVRRGFDPERFDAVTTTKAIRAAYRDFVAS